MKDIRIYFEELEEKQALLKRRATELQLENNKLNRGYETAWAELNGRRAEQAQLIADRDTERDRANDLLKDKQFAEAECARLSAQLAAHAVIDAPAGVPSVGDLIRIYREAFDACECSGERLGAGCTAIRDAVLAGVAAPVWTDDQIEELAQVLQKAYSEKCGGCKNWDDWPAGVKDGFLAEARAAVEFMRVGPPETPKGLPSAEELAAISDAAYCEVHDIGGNWSKRCIEHRQGEIKAADAILTYLRPWLRDPTGWELDVLTEEAAIASHNARLWSNHATKPYDRLSKFYVDSLNVGAAAVLDLCRSRIRPTFECAECAKFVAKIAKVNEINGRNIAKEFNAAREKAYAAQEAMSEAVNEMGLGLRAALVNRAAARAALEGE